MHIVDRFDFGNGLFDCFMFVVFVLIAALNRLGKNPRIRTLPRIIWTFAILMLIEGIHSIAQGVGVPARSPFQLTFLASLLVLTGAITVIVWDAIKEARSIKSTNRQE